jgi:multiple sugar transport system permease protein
MAGQPESPMVVSAVSRRSRASVRMGRLGPYGALLPTLIIIGLFSLYPLGYAVYLSLHEYVLTNPFGHPFTGLQNVQEVIGEDYFRASLTATAIYTVMAVPMIVVVGLLAALLLNTKLRIASFLRVVIVLPWAIPSVVAGILWQWLFSDNYGVINDLLYTAGVIHHYIPWLSQPNTARLALAMAQLWKELPFATIFFLAGLQTIPPGIVDAAVIDGASPFRVFRHIIVPLLRPVALVVLVYETVLAMTTFDLVFIMTGGGPANATGVLSWYAYQETFTFLNLGHGAALSFIIAVLMLVLILGYLRLLRSEDLYTEGT